MPRRPERSLDASAITALAPVAAIAPFWLLSLMIIWVPLWLLIDLAWWVLPVGWLGLGIALFVPVAQTVLIAPAFGARQPSPDEHARLRPIWDAVARQAGLPAGRFHLRIIDSDELNAFACGGHLVIVTTFALDELHDDELAGVFAHELSHHLGFHTVALTVGHWLSVPVVLLARVGFLLQNIARAATSSFARRSPVLTFLGGLVALILQLVAWLFLGALYASDAIANMVGHRSEFEADRRAVSMGYGRELASALRALIDLGGGRRTAGWRARLAASHPPARTRIARIEAMRRHPGRRRA